MRCTWLSVPVWAGLLLAFFVGTATADDASDGFESIFDGESLKNWDGNPEFWSVEDGAITGQTTAEKPTKGNTFILWRGGELEDFELRLKFRIVGGNSGIQFRSKDLGKWVVGGYQADFDGAGGWTGTFYEERGRGILAKRGTKVVIHEDGKKEVVGETTPEKKILESVKKEDWNDYTVIAQGNHVTFKVNGLVTVDLTDDQKEKRPMKGILALQLHAGPPMKVQFKDIQLKRLASTENKKADAESNGAKKIVFLAGRPSHGYGPHEHYAGCKLLAEAIEKNVPNVKTTVFKHNWPEDTSALEEADAIVVYCDGGGGHPVSQHLDEIEKQMKRGVGLVCLHYAVEVTKGKPGDEFLAWIGGYFEMNWSVNPHWTAEFKEFPKHPTTRGVQPFAINDEWYYHMRFRPNLQGVTPILSALPPESTLKRPDGPHSNNPFVREAVLERKEPQHVAWAYERSDGGRGFGFTGGHVHWNWGNDNFRKLVLNAIAWTAKADVPKDGVPSESLTVEQLQANQDYPPPKNFNPESVENMLKQWRTAEASK